MSTLTACDLPLCGNGLFIQHDWEMWVPTDQFS